MMTRSQKASQMRTGLIGKFPPSYTMARAGIRSDDMSDDIVQEAAALSSKRCWTSMRVTRQKNDSPRKWSIMEWSKSL